MFMIEHETYVIIPVAYNLFLYSLKDNTTPRFAVEHHLPISFIGTLVEYCKIAEANKRIIIDMKNILSYPSRAFTEFISIDKTLFFVFLNVNASSSIKDRIIEDLSHVASETTSDADDVILSSFATANTSIDELCVDIQKIEQDYLALIIESTVEREKSSYPLESSTIHGKTYVNFKNLFFNISNATYIIYKMTELIIDSGFHNADAIISASKTGAVFANVIGLLLDKKTVHCMGIGPKFSVSTDLLKKEIRKGKRYLFIGDFICLGTELKILNALVITHGAKLIGGICASSYLQLDTLNTVSILSQVKYLRNIADCNVDYQISIKPDSFNRG